MKKFILMLAISLGGIFSTQAQSNTTFDFSCVAAGPSQEERDFGFNRDQEPLFETNDLDMLTDFTLGGANDTNGVHVDDINHYAIHIGTPIIGFVSIDAELNDAGILAYFVDAIGPNTYLINVEFGTLQEAIEDALAKMRIIADTDGNGFIPVEEEMLSEATFSEGAAGVYNYSFDDGSSYIELSITTRDDITLPFVLDGEDLLDANGNYGDRLTYHATLQDALDYILMTYPNLFN